MNVVFPNVRTLSRPEYVYSEDGASTHVDKLRGLLRHHPFRSARIANPSYLFIFCDRDRDYANNLFLSLQNGIGSFPGLRQFVGISISKEQVSPLRLPDISFDFGSEAGLLDAVRSHLGKATPLPDFAFVIGDNEWKYRRPSPYGAIKAALLEKQIPSQLVSRQLLEVDQQFRYAVPNIALSTLAKLDGVPWLVKRQGADPSLVIGVGTTQVRGPHGDIRQRVIGYAVCMLSTGLFLDLSFFGAAFSHEEFLPQLVAGLGSPEK